MPAVQSRTPARTASPALVKLTASRTRLSSPSPLKGLCWYEKPESSTAKPMPAPVRPSLCGKVVEPVLRTAAVPVTVSTVLVARFIRRFGEMLCTSGRAAIVLTWWAGSSAARASTEP